MEIDSFVVYFDLDNSTLKDRKHSQDLLRKFDLLSVNQTAIQIKLMEAWKSIHIKDYPI